MLAMHHKARMKCSRYWPIPGPRSNRSGVHWRHQAARLPVRKAPVSKVSLRLEPLQQKQLCLHGWAGRFSPAQFQKQILDTYKNLRFGEPRAKY